MSYRRFFVSEICETLSGLTPRGRLEPSATGNAAAIQLRDLTGDSTFDPAGASRYHLDQPHNRYLAGAGDLLFRSRGDRNIAVVIKPGSTSKAVAVLPLVILRPKRELVDPRYLAWAINQPPAQRYFDKFALGTNIRMITKAALDDLEVELPSISKQELIVEVDALARREHQLTRELADKRLEMVALTLFDSVRAIEPR